MVGQPQQTTQRYSCTIATSDPTSGTIEALLPGQLKPVMVRSTPVAFRWPIAGETWWIENINGTFCLLAPVPIQSNGSSDVTTAQSDTVTTINDVAPGDVVLNAPTGKIWVLGDNTGANDYSFSNTEFTYAPAVAPAAPVAGFTIYVDVADGKLKAKAHTGTVTTLASP